MFLLCANAYTYLYCVNTFCNTIDSFTSDAKLSTDRAAAADKAIACGSSVYAFVMLLALVLRTWIDELFQTEATAHLSSK